MIFRSQRVENSFLLVHLFTDMLLFFLLVRMQLQWHCTRLVLAELTVLTEAEWATWWTAEQRQPRPWCIGRRLIPWPSIQNTTIRPNITGIISEEAETWWNDTTQEKRKKKKMKTFLFVSRKIRHKIRENISAPQQSFVLQFVHLPKKLLTLITWKKKLFLKIITT